MEFGWQDLAALGIVLAAAGYMARLAWNAVTRKRGSGCVSGCGSCSAQTSSQSGMRDPKPEQIVSIGMIGPIRKDLPLPSLADVVGPLHDNFRQSGMTEEEVDTLIEEEVKAVRAERRARQAP
ncbi:MAG: FeoB-associated Cys-rich membrane protein [Isosphaeraceae bacterium]